jgi:hypothetical protein
MLKNRQTSRICRKKNKSIAQAQRVFKTAPLFALTNPAANATPTVLAAFTTFFESLWSPATGTVAAAQKSGMSYVYDEDLWLQTMCLVNHSKSNLTLRL